jgi:hypothetical protein
LEVILGSRDSQREKRRSGAYAATSGARASARWLDALGLDAVPRWYASLGLAGTNDSHFELGIYAEEWGFEFRRGSRASWIRITDVAFIHGRDDFDLLPETPDLVAIGQLIAKLEQRCEIELHRASATIRTNLPGSVAVIREWLAQAWPLTAQRKTVELCGAAKLEGIRCTLARGHDGEHEHLGGDGGSLVRWK